MDYMYVFKLTKLCSFGDISESKETMNQDNTIVLYKLTCYDMYHTTDK